MVLGFINSLKLNNSLIFSLAKRSILERYQGSVLGVVWSFFIPITMLLVYTFVFGFVFQSKWNVDATVNFPLILFVGLMMHAVLSESFVGAPMLIVSQVNYVKKIVFPLECLAWVSLLRSMFHLLVSVFILLAVHMILNGNFFLNWMLFPIVLLPFIFFNLGVLWLLSSLGVYIRDISQVTPILSSVLIFLCPIFYPLEAIPESYHLLLFMNPLTVIVEESRNILVFNRLPDFFSLAVYTLFSYIFAQLSYTWFMKTKKGFADVL